MKFWCLDKSALTYGHTIHCLRPFDWPNRRMREFWSKVFGVRLPEMTHRFVSSTFLPPCRVSTQWLGSSKWLARGGRRSRCVHFCAMHSQCLPKTVARCVRQGNRRPPVPAQKNEGESVKQIKVTQTNHYQFSIRIYSPISTKYCAVFRLVEKKNYIPTKIELTLV